MSNLIEVNVRLEQQMKKCHFLIIIFILEKNSKKYIYNEKTWLYITSSLILSSLAFLVRNIKIQGL